MWSHLRPACPFSLCGRKKADEILSSNASEFLPDGNSNGLEPVYFLEVSNASNTIDIRNITAGDYFMEWYVAEAEYHAIAGEGYPHSVFARFTTDTILLTGTLEVIEGGMDGIAAFYPDEESLEKLPRVILIDEHLGMADMFYTGTYGADYELFADIGIGIWEDVVINVDSVFLAIQAPSYSRTLHTTKIVDFGVKVSDEGE